MPEYLSPGVYIEEVNKGTRPIEGVGTAMAAFVGFAPAGPLNRPVLITNWSQYVETFGRLEEGGGRNVTETVNQASQLVQIVEAAATGSLAERAPEAGTYLLKAPAPAAVPQV